MNDKHLEKILREMVLKILNKEVPLFNLFARLSFVSKKLQCSLNGEILFILECWIIEKKIGQHNNVVLPVLTNVM